MDPYSSGPSRLRARISGILQRHDVAHGPNESRLTVDPLAAGNQIVVVLGLVRHQPFDARLNGFPGRVLGGRHGQCDDPLHHLGIGLGTAGRVENQSAPPRPDGRRRNGRPPSLPGIHRSRLPGPRRWCAAPPSGARHSDGLPAGDPACRCNRGPACRSTRSRSARRAPPGCARRPRRGHRNRATAPAPACPDRRHAKSGSELHRLRGNPAQTRRPGDRSKCSRTPLTIPLWPAIRMEIWFSFSAY